MEETLPPSIKGKKHFRAQTVFYVVIMCLGSISYAYSAGIIGNLMTYEQRIKQCVAILAGIDGWAGNSLAAGRTKGTDGLGAVGSYAALSNYTALGGTLTVFGLHGK